MDGNISATSSAFNLSSLTGVPTNQGATADTLASLEDYSKVIDLRLYNLERKFNMA